MKPMKSLFFLVVGFFMSYHQYSYSQQLEKKGKMFIHSLNTYNTKQLEKMISTDFCITRDFTSFQHNRSSFLSSYIHNSKILRAKFEILTMQQSENQLELIVLDYSDYITYLAIKAPTWKIILSFQDATINRMHIVATAESKNYLNLVKLKDDQFKSWHEAHYPLEELAIDNLLNPIYIQRLKEFLVMNH
jgi:hypothetical protein